MKTNRYPTNWSSISRKVRRQAGWKCTNCGQPHKPKTSYRLEVHHLDGNPKNNDPANLIALCLRCHRHLQRRYQFGQMTLWPMPYTRWGSAMPPQY